MDARFVVKCDHIVGVPPTTYLLHTCPRCLGLGTFNAYTIGSDGKFVMVQGTAKVVQQIKKIITEQKRPSGYGFDYSVLSGVITPSSVIAIKSEVLRCIEYLKNSQQQEQREGFNYLPTERISRISAVDAYVDPADPRGVFVTVSVYTVSGDTAEVLDLPIRR